MYLRIAHISSFVLEFTTKMQKTNTKNVKNPHRLYLIFESGLFLSRHFHCRHFIVSNTHTHCCCFAYSIPIAVPPCLHVIKLSLKKLFIHFNLNIVSSVCVFSLFFLSFSVLFPACDGISAFLSIFFFDLSTVLDPRNSDTWKVFQVILSCVCKVCFSVCVCVRKRAGKCARSLFAVNRVKTGF